MARENQMPEKNSAGDEMEAMLMRVQMLEHKMVLLEMRRAAETPVQNHATKSA